MNELNEWDESPAGELNPLYDLIEEITGDTPTKDELQEIQAVAVKMWLEEKTLDDQVQLAVELSRTVHDLCKDVPHDIGLTLVEVINRLMTIGSQKL